MLEKGNLSAKLILKKLLFMKKILCLALVFTCLKTTAQNSSNYYFMQKNKTVEITITDKKGNPAGKQVYNISNATISGNSASSAVNSEMFDKKGKSVAKATTNVKCNNGVLMMDMKMMMPATTNPGAYHSVPSKFKGIPIPITFTFIFALNDIL